MEHASVRRRWWGGHVHQHNDGLYFNPEYGDIVFVRRDDVPCFNIRPRFAHHTDSKAKLDWGRGSGRAGFDLALNVLDVYLPANAGKGKVAGLRKNMTKLRDGKLVNDEAFRLHRLFAYRFIYSMDAAGGVIRGEDIVAFLEENGVDWTPDMWRMKDRSIPDDSWWIVRRQRTDDGNNHRASTDN